VSKPNVVCVSVDSLRADFCSFDDGDARTTPFLRSVTPEATVFESAISPSIWTLPVHTSVFTGLYPPEHGVTSEGRVLGDHPTFAELLAEEGYSTAAFFQNSWLRLSGTLRGFPVSDINDGNPPLRAKVGEAIGSLSPTAESVVQSAYYAQKLYRHWRTPGGDASGIDSGGSERSSRH